MQANEIRNKTIAEARADILAGLAGYDEKTLRIKKSLYRRYADIATAMYDNPVMEGVIRGNPDTFAPLCNKLIYVWVTSQKNTAEFQEVAKSTPSLNKLFSSSQELLSALEKVRKIVGKEVEITTFRQLVECLANYKPDNIIPAMDDIEIVDEDGDGYFEDENVETSEQLNDTSTDNDIEIVDEESDIDTIMDTSDDEDDFDLEAEANTDRVMNVYKDLFEVGFELQIPYGILVKEGILRLDKNDRTVLKTNSSMANLYSLINDCSSKFLVQSTIGQSVQASKLREVKMRSGTTYYPEFQLGNLFGILGETRVDSWEALSRAIRSEVKQNIKANLAEGKDISFIVDALTTCIIVTEFNPRVSMKLRINVGNRLMNANTFRQLYEQRKNTILAGNGEIYHINQLKTGVVEVTLVFNKDAFNGRPLFAYEAVQALQKRGRTPSLKEMILGQDTSGKIFTANLNRQNACVILIGAGQRSGKGVLTLNLLGTVLAEGHPLVYLDGKPDMAKVLWNIARKNNVNAAVWDAFDNNGIPIGKGAPEDILRENSDIFGVLMYLKVLQLMMAASHLRATKNIMVGGANKRPFFIFDEALAVQTKLYSAWQGIIRIAKDKKDTSETAEWCRRIVQWAEQLSASLVGTINSQLPMSGVSTVWLFQTIQPSSWSQFDLEGMKGKFNIFKNPIMSRLSIKLLGRGTTDSEYGLGNKNIKTNEIITQRVVAEGGRHFVYTDAQKVTDMNLVKVFKPYLVLNEAKNGTPSVEELRSNLSPEVWNAIAPEGHLPPEAGFEGFAELLGTGAVQNLALGRAFLEEVMQHLGLTNYSSIEDYIYDASIDSFRSLGTLLNERDNMDIDGYGEAGGSDIYYINKTDYNTNYDDTIQIDTDEEQSNGLYDTIENINTVGYRPPIGYGTPVIDRQMQAEINARRILESEITSGDEGLDDEFNITSRILVENRHQQATQMAGKDGRKNVVDIDTTRNVSKLTDENCIDCREAGPGPLSWIERMTLDTPAGAERYVKKIWKSILDTIVSKGYRKANITRVSLHGGQMYVNGKIVNLNGVIGGYQCIRLRDIVNFKLLFKTFFMIKELRMDEEMLRAATAELGNNPIEQFFTLAPKLEVVYVQTSNGTTIGVDRQTAQNQRLQRVIEKGKLENAIDLHCATKSKKDWSKRLAGDNIWGLNLAKSAMSNAGRAFMDQNKPRFGKAAIYAATGLVVGTIGGLAWGAAKIVGNIINLSRGFKR